MHTTLSKGPALSSKNEWQWITSLAAFLGSVIARASCFASCNVLVLALVLALVLVLVGAFQFQLLLMLPVSVLFSFLLQTQIFVCSFQLSNQTMQLVQITCVDGELYQLMPVLTIDFADKL